MEKGKHVTLNGKCCEYDLRAQVPVSECGCAWVECAFYDIANLQNFININWF